MIFAVGHQARSGKDTFANYICKRFPLRHVYILSFATALYMITEELQRIIGVPVEKNAALLQKIGTVVREVYSPNTFADIVRSQITHLQEVEPDCIIVIPDCRFKNEFAMCREIGAIMIKINRRNRPIDRDPNHISEIDLIDADWDHIIDNNSDLESFHENIELFIKAIEK